MPNILDGNGLQVSTHEELVTYFTAMFQDIYGPDINLDSDSPDGQLMNIFIQSILDIEDLMVQVYNMFDPDNAIGVVLDQRVAINGIQRQAGTFTVTNITLTTNQALNIYGLDAPTQSLFTVADAQGNEWVLIASLSIPGPGSYVAAFRSKVPGAVLTSPNTITVPVTVVLGVQTINNPTTYTSLGLNEETDAALKIRRQQSVSLASQGYLAGLLAALENISGVLSAFVYENNTGTTDGDGIPGHTIWVIVSGTVLPADVANAIYLKRNAGAGMFGDQTYVITQVDGSPFVVRFDYVESEDLYIRFTATSIDGINAPNIAAIRSGLVSSFVPGVNAKVDINHLATLVQDIDPNTLITNAGFSTAAIGPFTTTLSPSSKKKQFAVSAANIIITPMIFSPVVATVPVLGNLQLTALGGFGAYTYSIPVNNTGGSIDVNGLYTAGPITGTDVVRATDTQANFADATITVV